jgi:methylmalonyl-CoA/ethylmalonyl-CoA epimerase
MHSLRLHHVGYAVDHIEPNAQAYIARFGYQATTPILHDPIQTAHVQFLRLPGDQTYLEFVAPDSPTSKLIGVTAKAGGGLNHLCYIAGPLEQAIAHLETTGLRLIADPKPAIALGGRRICWLLGPHRLPIELVERRHDQDLCEPGLA